MNFSIMTTSTAATTTSAVADPAALSHVLQNEGVNHNNHHNNSKIEASVHDTDHHHGSGHGDDDDDMHLLSLYIAPMQRQRWRDTQELPHTNWGDIFFDLFYVAAAYNLGNLLRLEPTRRGLLYMAGCFFPIMDIWLHKLGFDSRYFYANDTYHRSFEAITLVVLATCVLYIRPVSMLALPDQHPDMFAFSLAVTLASLMTQSRLMEIMICVTCKCAPHLHPESFYAARREFIVQGIRTTFYITATVYAGLQFYSNDSSSSLSSSAGTTEQGALSHSNSSSNASTVDGHLRWLADASAVSSSSGTQESNYDDVPIWLILFGPFVGSLASSCFYLFYLPYIFSRGVNREDITVPVNVDYVIHRQGEWTMLMLGESVLSLSIVTLVEDWDYYRTFFAGMLSIILLQYLHFRAEPLDAEDHVLRRSIAGSLVYYHLQQVYSLALVILGTSYKMFLYEFVYEDISSHISGTGGNDRRLQLMSALSRLLSSNEGDDITSRFDTEDRYQRIGNFFSGSMAMVWFLLDVMTLTHKGIKGNLQRCNARKKSLMMRFVVFSLIAVRFGLIVFIGTLSQYETRPANLACIGFVGIVLQILIRALFQWIFPPEDEEVEAKAIDRMVQYAAAHTVEVRKSEEH